MSITPLPMKTKAERTYAEQFEAVSAKLPGGTHVASARRAAMANFNTLGLPHRRVEEWKYTDLRAAVKEALPPAVTAAKVTEPALLAALGPLASIDCWRLVFVDGRFVPELSPLDGLSEVAGAVLVTNLARTHVDHHRQAAVGRSASDAVVALNHAFATDGAVIEVPAQSEYATKHVASPPGPRLDRPIMMVLLNTAAEPATVTTRSFITFGAGVTAAVIEVHAQIGTAAIHTNAAVEMTVGAGAVIDHVKVVLGDAASGVHLSNWDVVMERGAIYRPAHVTPGAGLARNHVAVTLAGAGGKLDFAGIALGRANDHIDTTMVIHHVAPGCESRELFKTVLDGNARAVFQGKVIVDKNAQKTDGKQMAKALMLSPTAEFDSKPELEIYADDVVCGHGSTCAEIDPDLIFYCRSRGIPEADARALLLESFVGDAIDKIDAPDIRRAVAEIASQWLGQRLS
jgi:Fe-S cluster assembly protein SufD